MWRRGQIERPADLAIRCQMAARAGDPRSLLAHITSWWLGYIHGVERGKIKRLRIVTHVAGFAAFFELPGTNRPWINPSVRVSRSGRGMIRRKLEQRLLQRRGGRNHAP